MTRARLAILSVLVGLAAVPALAQDKGTLDAKPLPPLADPSDPHLPAKQVFGRVLAPAELQARSIGFYAEAASRAPRRCRSTGRRGR